jgi:hypothetical protein
MKKLYISAWILFALTALVTVFTGTFSSLALVVFSLVALGLVYALALRSVIANTRDKQPQQ